MVCDISQPLTVTGGRITLDFTPDPRDPLGGGTYRYRGDFGKSSVSGEGTHKVRLTASGGSLIASGPGNAKTKLGTFSDTGEEQYDLTPVSCEQARRAISYEPEWRPMRSPLTTPAASLKR